MFETTVKTEQRLFGRQFATPMTAEEIEQVSGANGDSNVIHPGPGTCTLCGDDD